MDHSLPPVGYFWTAPSASQQKREVTRAAVSDDKRSLPPSQSLQWPNLRVFLHNNFHAILEFQDMFIKNLEDIFLFLLSLHSLPQNSVVVEMAPEISSPPTKCCFPSTNVLFSTSAGSI